MPKKILIVDDDRAISLAIEFQLSHEGFTVLLAGTGEAALKMAADKKPDLILLDLLLPTIRGFDVLKILKGQAATRDIPVAIFSNYSQIDNQEIAEKMGAATFFVKSDLSIDELVGKIKKLMK